MSLLMVCEAASQTYKHLSFSASLPVTHTAGQPHLLPNGEEKNSTSFEA